MSPQVESPDPVKSAADDPQLRRAVQDACQRCGLDFSDARLIHRYNNAIYLLPVERCVARVTGTSTPVDRAAAVHRVVEWLVAEQQVQATRPLPGIAPVRAEDLIVGFWRYYPQPEKAAPTSRELAGVLRRLHAIGAAPVPLPQWVPLASLSAVADEAVARSVLSTAEVDWLTARIRQVREEIASLEWPLGVGLIHGDAWAGNLLWDTDAGTGGAVLGDWDNLCIGPREVDLVPSWHAAIRYGRGPRWAAAFAEVYGYDLSSWRGFDTLLRIRDLVQLTGPLRRAHAEPVLARALRVRFDAIRNGDRTSVWRAY